MYRQTLCVTLPISAAVIIAAGLFANAGDLNPPPGEIQPTMHTLEEIYATLFEPQCCSPRSEDIWSYLESDLGNEEIVIIPRVPGENGSVLTDIVASTSYSIRQDTGEGPVPLLPFGGGDKHFSSGVPLIVGATITVVLSGSGTVLVSGYSF